MQTFQRNVARWSVEAFGHEIACDKVERNHRFAEEALELVQSLGCTKEEVLQLVDYVYGRPKGDPSQEVGGVMITLASLCEANNIHLRESSEVELDRIKQPYIMKKIRAKQAAKPKFSPLPE